MLSLFLCLLAVGLFSFSSVFADTLPETCPENFPVPFTYNEIVYNSYLTTDTCSFNTPVFHLFNDVVNNTEYLDFGSALNVSYTDENGVQAQGESYGLDFNEWPSYENLIFGAFVYNSNPDFYLPEDTPPPPEETDSLYNYTDIFSVAYDEIIAMLIVVIPYALGIFALYLALKFAKKTFNYFSGDWASEKAKYDEQMAETDRLLK